MNANKNRYQREDEKRRRGKVCMVTYLPNPSLLPPMYNTAVSLSEEGFEVEVICVTNDANYALGEEVQDTFTVHKLFSRSSKFFNDRYGLSPSSIFQASIQYAFTYLEFNWKAAWTAFRSNADVYEAHDLPALFPTFLAALLRRKPLVYRAHELYPEMHEKVKFAGLWKFLERLLVPRARFVVTPDENRSMILYRERGAKAIPLTVRNCPPYMSPTSGTTLRSLLHERGLNPRMIVLYQGLFDDSRCMRELIHAADHFNDGIYLVLVGGGFNEWAEPEKIIGDSKRVVVLPRVSYSELNAYTSSADVGILFYRNNCRNNYYCAPNKVFEYMMMGLPVVTNNYPGISAIVEGGQIGYCVDSENPKEIAAAVNKLADNPREYDAMKRNCLKLSETTYNWEQEYKKLKTMYEQMMGRHSRPENVPQRRTTEENAPAVSSVLLLVVLFFVSTFSAHTIFMS